MIDSFSITDLIANFAPVSIEAVKLSDDRVNRAIQVSTEASSESQQWNIYLQAIAVLGFERWLSERISNLAVRYRGCSTFQPAYANLLQSVCNLQVGDFRLCLLVVGSASDEMVAVPRATLELEEFRPDFYVAIEVEEEQDQIWIKGCSIADRLKIPESPEPDWTYSVPIACFSSSPDDLLLWLNCLQVKPLTRALPRLSYVPVDQLQVQLLQMLPQIQKSDCQPWQILTWEQGATILTHPELAEWFDRQRRSPLSVSPEPAVALEAQSSTVATQAIEASLWLRNELDGLARELGWNLLPPLASSMRATNEEVEAMMAELKRKGMSIPFQARGVYRDLSLLGVSLRLYAIIWPLVSPSPAQLREWTLLLILGPQMNRMLNSQVRLTIRDECQLLVEQSLEPNSENTYLYARVAGSLEEQFWATIELNHYGLGSIVTLPPFCFACANQSHG